MDGGPGNRAAYNHLNLVKDCTTSRRSTGAIGKTTLTILSAISGTLAPISWGCHLFSERISNGGEEEDCRETRNGKGPRPIRFNKAADQSHQLLASLTHLQGPLFARVTPPQHRHLLKNLFPPCGRVGSTPCVPEWGVPVKTSRHKRRGRAWVAMSSSYNDIPNQG
ncbi:hypothetical protein GWK47_051724 [Chionoecetes opilio]|uniref:Uncharacterized protein n=1 Tax=Chionoecetes opilio TaxID=41210 RepID=A0A8J4YCI1_CHIOP|nr:hypothetical protein GWK47_051724 [Chionoecetes opilio]